MPVSARSSKDATDQSFLGSWFEITRIGSVGITPRKLTVRCLDRTLSSSQFLNLDFCLKEREKMFDHLFHPSLPDFSMREKMFKHFSARVAARLNAFLRVVATNID